MVQYVILRQQFSKLDKIRKRKTFLSGCFVKAEKSNSDKKQKWTENPYLILSNRDLQFIDKENRPGLNILDTRPIAIRHLLICWVPH